MQHHAIMNADISHGYKYSMTTSIFTSKQKGNGALEENNLFF